MTYNFKPKGVCSQDFVFEIEDGIVQSLEVKGGCNGNLKGIASLLVGMPIDEVIKRLEGVTCGFKSTSCPDQIAKALSQYKLENN